jgi:hypothetical protein
MTEHVICENGVLIGLVFGVIKIWLSSVANKLQETLAGHLYRRPRSGGNAGRSHQE